MGRFDGKTTEWVEDVEDIAGCFRQGCDPRMGGQHVAKTCAGVTVRHKPTGICVVRDSERSRHGNRVAAIEQLRTILDLLFPNEQEPLAGVGYLPAEDPNTCDICFKALWACRGHDKHEF